MTMNDHKPGTACSCHFICTYDRAKKKIAWYNEVDGRLSFIGYGSTAPSGYAGYHQEGSKKLTA